MCRNLQVFGYCFILFIQYALSQSPTDIPFLNFTTTEELIFPNDSISTTFIPDDPTTSPTTLQPTAQPTKSPTLQEFKCSITNPNDDDFVSTKSCPGFCGTSREETIFIGQEIELCEDHDDDITTQIPIMPETTETEESTDDTCVNKDDIDSITYGCGIPWLCMIIQSETNNNCVKSNILQNSLTLECDINDHLHNIYATSTSYTQYLLTQYCCTDDECNADIDITEQECSWESGVSDGYNTYNKLLYECRYGEEHSVNNRYEIGTKCNKAPDHNDYDDTCDYLISYSYSLYGCQCKSSYATGDAYKSLTNDDFDFGMFTSTMQPDNMNSEMNDDGNNDDPSLIDVLIDDWISDELVVINLALKVFGCASNIECVNDNNVYGGLLNIEQVLYIVTSTVFLPHSLISTCPNVITCVELKIVEKTDGNTDITKIYTHFNENDNGDDPSAEGRVVDIKVVYLDEMLRDDLYKQWNETGTNWFGDGSTISNIKYVDINDTLQYHGSDPYYYVPQRDTESSFIAAIVLACVVGGAFLVTVILCTFL